MTIYELFGIIAENGEPWDFHYLSSKVTKEQYEQLDDKELFILVYNIMSLRIDYKDKDASFRSAYVWQDGSKSFAPEDISDDDIIRLYHLDYSRLPLAV